jgi:hypothetical protein
MQLIMSNTTACCHWYAVLNRPFSRPVTAEPGKQQSSNNPCRRPADDVPATHSLPPHGKSSCITSRPQCTEPTLPSISAEARARTVSTTLSRATFRPPFPLPQHRRLSLTQACHVTRRCPKLNPVPYRYNAHLTRLKSRPTQSTPCTCAHVNRTCCSARQILQCAPWSQTCWPPPSQFAQSRCSLFHRCFCCRHDFPCCRPLYLCSCCSAGGRASCCRCRCYCCCCACCCLTCCCATVA